VIAKTCHYFADHLRSGQHQAIGRLLQELDAISPLVQPAVAGHGFDPVSRVELRDRIGNLIERSTGLRRAERDYTGWVGVTCPSVGEAISMMRLLSTTNVLSRREDTILYVPVNPMTDPTGEIVTRAVAEVTI